MASGRPLVVGYGNDLRGDDGVGQEVAKILWSERHSAGLAGATIIWSVQLLPEMALDLSHCAFAVFVDAAHDPDRLGSVNVSQLAAEEGRGGAGGSGCWLDLTPMALLSLAQDLYGAAPPAVLVTVSVGLTTFGPGLSGPVAAAVPMAVRAVEEAMAGWGISPQPPSRHARQVLHA